QLPRTPVVDDSKNFTWLVVRCGLYVRSRVGDVPRQLEIYKSDQREQAARPIWREPVRCETPIHLFAHICHPGLEGSGTAPAGLVDQLHCIDAKRITLGHQ